MRLGFSFFLIFVVSFPTWAESQFEEGKRKAAVCMTCHGQKGLSKISTYPNLQGQHVDYLVASLKAYKNRHRKEGLAKLMHAYADKLSERDMKDISVYYNKVR
jgi:cytochrome c553